mgnify:FL=1
MSTYFDDANARAMADFDNWLTHDPRGDFEPEDWDPGEPTPDDAAEVQHLLADAASDDRDAFDADLTAAIGEFDLTAAFDLLDADADALAEIVLTAMSSERRPGPGVVRCAPRSEAELFDVLAPWHALDEDTADALAERMAVGL